MNLQRKLTLAVATGAVALGAGHFVQNKAANRMAGDLPTVKVSSVVPVAAGPADLAARVPDVHPPVVHVATAPVSTVTAGVMPVPDDTTPERFAPEVLAAVEAMEKSPPLTAEPLPAAVDDCAVQFDLAAQPGAMVGLSLLAPCQPDQRVVLRHAGLAVTGRTSASGALFAALPALTDVAEVTVAFGSGQTVVGMISVPDFAGVRRFAVQWQDADAFQLHALENGAGYDQPGHISAAFTGTFGETGVLTVLGDASTALPLLAEVYTFGPDANAEIVVEAAVTEDTCGREILGETILAGGGSVAITDLTLAMPGCDAVGDILVLKNLAQNMTLALAN
ncbi:MAG: hypothetical protein JXR75_08375 [Rhodobacteraceae bacterium]|nr:hypothetical protein [Paracoccaceae bacterium]